MVVAMSESHFLSIKKLKGKGILKAAAKHNHREIAAELGVKKGGHIDPERVKNNIILRGGSTAEAVDSEAKSLLEKAGIGTLRKDAVDGLEIVFSLPKNTNIPTTAFFEEATRWVETYLGAPILSAVIHNDEAAPHCHVLILPLINGRMVGSDLIGYKSKLSAMQADFHGKVAARFGLARQAPAKHISAAIRRETRQMIFEALEPNSGLQSDILRMIVDGEHLQNPEPLLKRLSLKMP